MPTTNVDHHHLRQRCSHHLLRQRCGPPPPPPHGRLTTITTCGVDNMRPHHTHHQPLPLTSRQHRHHPTTNHQCQPPLPALMMETSPQAQPTNIDHPHQCRPPLALMTQAPHPTPWTPTTLSTTATCVNDADTTPSTTHQHQLPPTCDNDAATTPWTTHQCQPPLVLTT